MMRWAIAAAGIILALPLSAGAESGSQKAADLKEALRVQQLICNAMADVRARGANYSDNNFSLCFIDLEEQRAEYRRALSADGAPSRAEMAAGASLRPAAGGTEPAASSH
jgi:hypothetical protein